jgi:FkbM family methyltransferase
MYSDKEYLNAPIEIKKELKSFFKISRPKLILDIGSCDGLDSIKYSYLFPNSTIYAFEPIFKNLELIKKNIEKYKVNNIKIVDKALSNEEGEATFYLSSGRPEDITQDMDWDFGNKSSSLLPPAKAKDILPWLEFKDEIKVKTTTLYNFMNSKGFNEVDFIHMDVQGAELLVLEGAFSYIQAIKMIWLEVENMELYKNQPLKNDVEVYLSSKGFIKIKDTVNHIAGDQLWVNYNYFPRKKITRLLYHLYKKVFN